MLDGAEKILKYTSNFDFDKFVENEMVIDAVARNYEIIGEAANHPQVRRLSITGFRNRIIHEYFGIDYEIMWTIIEENIAELIGELKRLMN